MLFFTTVYVKRIMKKSIRKERARSEREVILAVIMKNDGGKTEMIKLSVKTKRNNADKIRTQTLLKSLFTNIPPHKYYMHLL